MKGFVISYFLLQFLFNFTIYCSSNFKELAYGYRHPCSIYTCCMINIIKNLLIKSCHIFWIIFFYYCFQWERQLDWATASGKFKYWYGSQERQQVNSQWYGLNNSNVYFLSWISYPFNYSLIFLDNSTFFLFS